MDRVSIERGGSEEDRSSFSAERIVCRKRTGLAGLVTYHDAREILLIDAHLAIHLGPQRESAITTLVRDLKRSLPPAGILAALNRDPSRSGFITRLLFEGLSLRVERSGGAGISLASKRARFDPDSDTLVLEGGFELSLPDGRTLRGPLAALSEEHDGIHLPRGYTLGAARVDHTTFLVPDAEGGLSAAAVVHAIAYEDHLESAEQAVIGHFLDRVPAELRLLFASLAQVRSIGDRKPDAHGSTRLPHPSGI